MYFKNLLIIALLLITFTVNAESIHRGDSNGKTWYIAAYKNCNTENLLVCGNYYSKMIQVPIGMPMYNYYIEDCENGKGNKITKRNNDFNNPFTKCSTKEYNIKSGNCYYSPYSKRVTGKGSARKAKGIKRINGRCLVGGGWCPC